MSFVHVRSMSAILAATLAASTLALAQMEPAEPAEPAAGEPGAAVEPVAEPGMVVAAEPEPAAEPVEPREAMGVPTMIQMMPPEGMMPPPPGFEAEPAAPGPATATASPARPAAAAAGAAPQSVRPATPTSTPSAARPGVEPDSSRSSSNRRGSERTSSRDRNSSERSSERTSERGGERTSDRPVASTTQPASARPGASTRPTDYYNVITERNIFVRERRRPVVQTTRTTQRATPPPPLEQTLVLRGVALDDESVGGFRAYFENTQTREVLRVAAGDVLAKGHVAEISIDAVAFENASGLVWVRVGDNLVGARVATAPAPAGVAAGGATTGPAGESDIARRMRERREQQDRARGR